jgi:GNAT superfamily N-acetyltransferase
MDDSVDAVQVAVAHEADGVAQAAAIWARAKAHRDQDPEPVTVDQAGSGIRERLGIEGGRLILARRNGRPVGFTLVAPRAHTLEVFYLGVAPEAWGSGVGTRLLLSVDDHAREIDRQLLELWVLNGNARAISVYQRSGWIDTGETQRAVPSGRLERRFTRELR